MSDFRRDGQWVAYSTFPGATLWRSKPDGSQRIQLSFPPLAALLPSWSPDGKQIVFFGFPPGQSAKLYMVSADGGTPRELIADDPELKYDADWSADGTRIVFANGPANPNSSIRMLDVKTNQLSSLPDSTGLYSPRWSPNGRYIVRHERRFARPDAVRLPDSEMAGTRARHHGFPQLVEKFRLTFVKHDFVVFSDHRPSGWRSCATCTAIRSSEGWFWRRNSNCCRELRRRRWRV